MPKLKHETLRVELEVTPEWWPLMGGKALGKNNVESALAISKAMLMAVDLFPNSLGEVRVSRASLKLVVMVPSDVTTAMLCEKAGVLVERMNGIVGG